MGGDDIRFTQATLTSRDGLSSLDEMKTRELPPRATFSTAPLRTAPMAGAAAAVPPADSSQRALAILERLAPSSGLEVGEAIGEGGMSFVHRGKQLSLGREVAVKTLLGNGPPDPHAMLRLLREAWITGALEHPNIVPVHDIVKGNAGTPQIVLKRIGGAAWSQVMHDESVQRESFAVRDALDWNIRILMQVCNAVHFAHSRGVIHRDLKSDNVMIGSFGEVYVLDWGLAVALTDDGTGRLPLAAEVDCIAGTPGYMAPEMLEGKGAALGVHTDVYLLGALLYEIVAGWPPHLAKTTVAMVEKIMRSTPALPSDVPGELGGIVRRALARIPKDRFTSADELRLALAAFLEHRASVALATEASVKLAELEVACSDLGDKTIDREERGQKRYHLFGECRFAFREALRAWPENTAARDGLRRAVVRMAEVELAEGDPRAAEMLVLELEEPPQDLAKSVRSARRAREESERRLASMARDHDPRIGRRVRMIVSACLGSIWTALPWIGWFLERSNPASDQRAPLASSSAMLVFAFLIAHRLREALSRSALNRNIVRSVGVVLVAQVVLFAVTYHLGVSYDHTRVLVLLLYAVCCALTAAAVEPKLWPAATAYAAIVLIASLRPSLAWPVESIANLALTINVLVIWRGEPDPSGDPPQSQSGGDPRGAAR